MTGSRVLETQALLLIASPPLSEMYRLSPYVWREGERFRIAIRAVNHAEDPNDKIARIYFGASADGREFVMEDEPGIAPSGGMDSLGCEDPTVGSTGEEVHVIYSGWDGERSRLLRASGRTLRDLETKGLLVPDDDRFPMMKEAAFLPLDEGCCFLFEYATEGASRIGEANGPGLTGPFALSTSDIRSRVGHWDSWHLSPCDCVLWNGRRILVYSGADRETRWRIGWAELDESCRVIARASEPLIKPFDLEGGDTDIAFASSVLIEDEALWIYYSVADRSLYRSRVEIGTEDLGAVGSLGA